MSIFEKQRFEIWNQTQHPYKHTLADFGYSNPSMPGIANVSAAIDWIMAVLYPNTKSSVDTVGDLPASGNDINDYRVVQDDGDGKAAGYRWEQRPGEADPSWHKIYDMDWGQDSVLAAWQELTQDYYVWRDGRDDIDAAGDPITGLYAGQTIYGGKSNGTNLTLVSNFGDNDGFIQLASEVRPDIDDTWSLGTSTERFVNGWFSQQLQIDTMTITPGAIEDSSGTIDFGTTNLVTEGDVEIGNLDAVSADFGTLHLEAASITDSSGNITFDGTNINDIGEITADSIQFGTLAISDGSILDTDGEIDFGATNLTGIGTLDATTITGTQLNVDNLRLDGNTFSSTNTNGNITVTPNGTGYVDVTKALHTLDQVVVGTLGVTGVITIDSLTLDGTTLSSSGGLLLDAASGVTIDSALVPTTNNTFALGDATHRFTTVYLSGVSDGTNTTSIATILGLRHTLYRDTAETLPAQNGDALFYNSASGTWLASAPDAEIDHASLSGLTTGDAGHTQFALLSGRPGGQALIGGTASGNNLDLESTSNVTKGAIRTKDNFVPFTNSSYSGGWSGADLGDSSHYFRNLYSKGEHIGLRFENLTVATLPSSSAQNVGRVMIATDNGKAYIDDGTSVKVLGVAKFLSDVSFDGVVTTKDVTVSASVADARTCQWQLKDNANDYENIATSIKATSASNVRITTNIALPSGSYRLIGLE